MLPDPEIVRGFLDGEPESHHVVSGWIGMVAGSRHWGLHEERDDILQEVRKRLYVNFSKGSFRGDSSLKTYVVQISKYVCIEFLRRQIRHRTQDLDGVVVADQTPSPEQALELRERERIVRDAILELPERCRKLFQLVFRDRLPYETIAEHLGIAQGTVKSRAWRCREMLTKALQPSETP